MLNSTCFGAGIFRLKVRTFWVIDWLEPIDKGYFMPIGLLNNIHYTYVHIYKFV